MQKQLGLGQLEAALETFSAMKRNLERYITETERRWILMLEGNFAFIEGKWSEAEHFHRAVHRGVGGRKPALPRIAGTLPSRLDASGGR